MSQMFRFICCWQRREPLPVDKIMQLCIIFSDCHVLDAHGGYILEEMGALGILGRELVIAQLDHSSYPGNILPPDRNAQGRISRPPASGTDEQIGFLFLCESGITAVDLAGYFAAIPGSEC